MNRYRLLVTISTAIAIAVSGCAQLGDTKSKQYAAQGCATGALATGLITYIVKYGDSDAMEKSLIAGVLGCMAGAVVGYQVGERTEDYVDAHDAARSEIARNEEQIQKLRQYNLQLALNVEDYKNQLSKIKASSLSEQEKMEDLKSTHDIITKQRVKATDSLTNVEADIAEANEQYKTHQAKAAPQEISKWQAELASYEKEKEILSEHVSTLNALDASI